MASIADEAAAPAAAPFDPEHGEELLLCARYGDLDDMNWYLTTGRVPVDFRNASNGTALHYACVNGHLACVEALLAQGAAHLPNLNNNTPLHWAVQQKHVHVVRALCAHTPDYVDVLFKNGFGKSALTVGFGVEDTDIVKVLLEHGSAAALESSRTKKKKKKKKKEEDGGATKAQKKIRQIKKKAVGGQKEEKQGTGEQKNAAATAAAATGDAKEFGPIAAAAAAAATASTPPAATLDTTETPAATDAATAKDKPIEEKSADPSGRQVSQRVIHVFHLDKPTATAAAATIEQAPTLVRVQEMAIDWEGAAFTNNDATQDVTGLYVWSASVVLARWLVSSALSGEDMSDSVRGVCPSLRGKRVCELGAGAGLPGIAVAAHAGAASVLLTDLFMHTVQNLEDNVALNNVLLRDVETRVSARSLDWSDQEQWPKERFDVLIGSDLVYDTAMVPTLVTVVKGMLLGEGAAGGGDGDEGGGVFYYAASTTERDGMVEFVAAMQEAGFELSTRAVAPRAYHTNPLHEATQTKCDLHFGGLKSKEFELFEWRI